MIGQYTSYSYTNKERNEKGREDPKLNRAAQEDEREMSRRPKMAGRRVGAIYGSHLQHGTGNSSPSAVV